MKTPFCEPQNAGHARQRTHTRLVLIQTPDATGYDHL